MSISPLSESRPIIYAVDPVASALNQGPLPQLGKAIQAGDLSQAQQIFSNIAARQASQTTSQPQQSALVAQDFKAVGQALQNNDLSAAKDAFSKLQQDVKVRAQTRTAANTAAHGHHGRHHRAGSGSNSATTTTSPASGTTSSDGTTGTAINILA